MKVLKRKPLCYRVASQTGSHRKLRSEAGYPDLDFAFHDGVEIGPVMVHRILVDRVGLSVDEAKELI
jgi:hypothetical protein